jgi:flavin-dependent dehydrogenase
MTPLFSTVVLGGGPAGLAAALALTELGQQVAVIERSRYDAMRVGETLAPVAKPLLHRLGVWEAFARDGHLPSPGVVSVWEKDEPYENDFIYNPFGHGWHLDRRRFDSTLAAAAEERGVRLYRAAHPLAFTRDPAGGWCVTVRSHGETFPLRAALLLDATGRAAWLARRAGARRLASDRLAGVVGLFRAGSTDSRLLLEAAEEGWWYSASLPDERLAVAYMTDLDLLPPPRDLGGFWAARLRRTFHTHPRVAGAELLTALRIVAADSYRMEPAAGPDWLAVGDAAMAWDPLSAQGVTKALESGLTSAKFAAALDGQPIAAEKYTAGVARNYEAYLRVHAQYYGKVRRWPGSPFWERRRRD